MSDSAFKTKYQKYKYKVKLWEKDFKTRNGRVPSKHDIREAPSAIRDAYKMYYKLKTSFLEETLSEALEDDAFDLSLLESSSQNDLSQSTSMSELSTPDITKLTNSDDVTSNQLSSISNLESSNNITDTGATFDSPALSTNANRVSTEFEAEEYVGSNEYVWGKELNRASSTISERSDDSRRWDMGSKLKKTMSDKLFRNSSFSKRNPRKSLSRNSLPSSQSNLSQDACSQKEILPDLETILFQKSQCEGNTIRNSPVGSSQSQLLSNGTYNINLEWLNRCNQDNNEELNESDTKSLASNPRASLESNPSYGISNINITALKSIDAVSLDSSVDKKSTLSFDMTHLNLRSSDSFNHQSVLSSSNSLMPTDDTNDDDDEIANSEDETNKSAEPIIRSIRNVAMNKRKRSQLDESQKSPAKSDEPKKVIVDLPKPKIVKRKPRVNSKAAVRTKSTEQTTEETQIRRKSQRNANVTTNYSTKKPDDSDSSSAEDPFACDDSDVDPDFGIDDKTKTKQKHSLPYEFNISSSSAEDKEETVVEKKSVKVRRRKVVVKKVPVKVATVRKRAGTKVQRSSLKKENTEIETASEETPDNYLMEFGIERIKSAPSIDPNELQNTTKKFLEYVNSTTTVASKPQIKVTKPLATRNVAAKEKLEKKIAAGTLNENFVRIDLRKKVFVRGKKTINFSRYKKKMWKQKKVAALSGPNMDMGGCDGGILTCFQCGMPGHFAQNCKVKSDRLLPLEAVTDESPFPTLQEAEEMSKQKKLVAHAGRELPESDNATWKSSDNENVDKSEEFPEQPISIDNEDSKILEISEKNKFIGHEIPEDFLKKAGLLDGHQSGNKQVEPLYRVNEDGTLPDTPMEVFEALKMFGHTKFRSGQEKAVMRILCGLSTLLTLSTGSGKSLCYQLPAYLYRTKAKCITLVISPLVSLMEDQVHGMPHFLNAQCLHTNQNKAKRDAIVEMIRAGEVHVLLISPEAIVAGEKSTGFGSILRDLPPIAFVCIDEAHCVSQWSHNFRPSYLMICRVLYEKLKVKTVLGLTATATLSSRQSIVRHLMIADGMTGVISDIPVPDNLTLTISCDENRDLALLLLLKEDKFAEFQSIIIYCSRRDECERVAKLLRTHFQDSIAYELQQRNTLGKRKRSLKTTIEPYHAGMPASRRRTIQNNFLSGDLKIVVATIAFGMGINKADIRAVIHYNMPMNFESYVQEIGRAGRDGQPAHCHLFLDSKGADKTELRRHIFGNSIDRHVIRKLLQKIFMPCACKKQTQSEPPNDDVLQADLDALKNMSWDEAFADNQVEEISNKRRNCPGHEVCFSVDDTVNELDLPEENISTLLCYLELHEQRYIKTLSKAYTQCKVFSYGGPKALKNAALNCPPLAMAIALDLKKGISHDSSTHIEFPVIEIASAIGWNSGVVKYQLKNLEWINENGLPKRSTISVEFYDLGFRLIAPGDLTDFELDNTLDLLDSRVKRQEKTQLVQLEKIFRALTAVSVKSCLAAARVEANDERSQQLKSTIRNYFQSNDETDEFNEDDSTTNQQDDSSDCNIVSDVRTMLSRYPENNFTGRALARIFHGIPSPVYPATIWGKCKYWRAHIRSDFNHIVKLANREILGIRTF